MDNAFILKQQNNSQVLPNSATIYSPEYDYVSSNNRIRRLSNPINALWTLLSLMVGGMATFAFIQPFWILEPRKPDCLGVFSYCVKDISTPNKDRQLCGIYGGNFSLSNLPSKSWKACFVLFTGGCAIHLLCAILSMISLCMKNRAGTILATYTGSLQALAVVMSFVGLLAFPAGFSSPLVQHFCITSDTFYSGKCEVGWGFLLAVMATALSIFCPILAQFYDVRVCSEYSRFAPATQTVVLPVDCTVQKMGPGSRIGPAMSPSTRQYSTDGTNFTEYYHLDSPPSYVISER